MQFFGTLPGVEFLFLLWGAVEKGNSPHRGLHIDARDSMMDSGTPPCLHFHPRSVSMAYHIITDSCCDLPAELCKKLDVDVISLTVDFKGETINTYPESWLREFYDGLKNGEVAQTAAANPENWKQALLPILEQGDDALVLVFSSGLSTTYQSAVIAAEELLESYPQRSISVVDTLSASMGQGLFVYYACKMRDSGLSLEDITAWCEENKHHVCQWFTVDDLMYLKRGGRVSAATALVGTMLQIKPVMHVDAEGHLMKVSTARGRKASIDALAKKVGETGLPGRNDTVFISHGNCPEDAQYLAQKLKAEYGIKEVIIYYIGAVIGSHSGPGTLALFFMGNQR